MTDLDQTISRCLERVSEIEREPQVGDIYQRGRIFRQIINRREDKARGIVYGLSVREWRGSEDNGVRLVWPTTGQMRKWATYATIVKRGDS